MKRIALCIGCDEYDHVEGLSGAHHDAERVFAALVDPTRGEFEPNCSSLLLSPTKDQARKALEKILFEEGEIDTLAFYFAGHGAQHEMGFYMCMRDSRHDRTTSSALWLSDILSLIADAKPNNVYLVFDACFSGSLVIDLNVLMRASDFGNAGSLAVTLLAASARDQYSMEGASGGVGTSALLDCICGSAFVQEHSAKLDLAEIGASVSKTVALTGQVPCVSSLNVKGSSYFCKNPFYQASTENVFRHWEPRTFLDAVLPVLRSQSENHDELLASSDRLFAALIGKANDAEDIFLQVEVIATAVAALLPFAKEGSPLISRIEEYISSMNKRVYAGIEKTVREIENNNFALIGNIGTLANIFYLPVRVSKLIGWAGAAYHFEKIAGNLSDFPDILFKRFINLLSEKYTLSFSTMIDTQAPFLLLGLSAIAEVGLLDEGEMILSSLFHSVCSVNGKIADAHIPKDQVLAYVIARSQNDYEEMAQLIARPSETIAVLLMCARLFELEDTFDQAMIELDHVAINGYIATNYSQFARSRIDGGENATFLIGHGIWTVADLHANWPSCPPPPSLIDQYGAIACSLIFPDRVPWFVLESVSPKQIACSQASEA